VSKHHPLLFRGRFYPETKLGGEGGAYSHHLPPYKKTRGDEGMIRSSEVVFLLQRQDVLNCAVEMGIPAEAITDDVLELVKKGVEFGLECWSEVVKEAINLALKS